MVRLGYSPTPILVGWLPSSNPKSHGDDCLVHQVSSSPWAGANHPLNLLAVDSSADRSKGDGDTATWLPTNKAYRCTYVARQVAVKGKYGLWVTLAERDAMIRVFTTCPAMGLPEPGTTSTVAVLPVLPTRLHLLQHLRRQRPLRHHYHRVGHRRNVGLLLTRKLHRSDTPRRHRTNRLEMAATSDRTLAAISNQRVEPASLWAL